MGCHALRQRIFPTQGSNPGLPHYKWILYRPSHQEPKNTGVVSLLQKIFSAQKLNQSLLHCRWILYQLSYQGKISVIFTPSNGIQKWRIKPVRTLSDLLYRPYNLAVSFLWLNTRVTALLKASLLPSSFTPTILIFSLEILWVATFYRFEPCK